MKKAVGIVIILGALGGGGYLLKDRLSAKTTATATKKTSVESWEELKKSHSLTVNTHMASPTGKAWQSQDLDKILTLFGSGKILAENRNFLQASIFVLDVTKPEFNPEKKEKLHQIQKQLVDYIVSNKVPVVGEQAKVHSYAAKVLLKLGPIPQESLKELEKFYNHSKDRHQKDIVADILIRTIPLSEVGKKIVTKMIASKTDVNEGLMLLGQVRDAEAQKQMMNQVYNKYPTYPESVKPFVYKQLVVNHGLVTGDLKKYLKDFSKKQDQDWNDAFLMGVKELDCINDFRSDVERIERESQYPHIKMLAKAILTSGKGAQ
ncbi:hypothetical protein [Bdellovibrio bacteriovorus]|uniref:hypothetical protein n=1 Tax=Bdellovibrio TaxID=958 RepID=UPI0035A8FEF3